MAAHDDKAQSKLTRLQQQLAKKAELDIDDAIAALAQHSNGRQFLWWLLQIGQVGRQPFTANALTTAFQCGELDVGNKILARIISVDPAIYVRMQQEQQANYDRAINANNADNASVTGNDDNRPGNYDHPDLGVGDQPVD